MAGDALIATLALGGLCILMWWLARLARKRMGIGAGTVSGDGLRVVGKRPLDQKHSLYVVEIAGGRHILVGTSMDGGISKLDDISLDEYAAMTRDEARPAPLKVASTEARDGDDDGDEPHDASTEPRFATVGESFNALLGKARDARASRRASGD
jgi:flagellar biogenesis protein FliO